jgi:glycolate oxidase iron-sulfur subunit
METNLLPAIAATPEGKEAESILRACVHCGFCTATCPTYQLLGDELDGPRGRIYLIKQALEGADVTAKTQLHLDRCLTCRACETTCPSGVRYGRLVDIGRKFVDERVGRSAMDAARRGALGSCCRGRFSARHLASGASPRHGCRGASLRRFPTCAAPARGRRRSIRAAC